jgi:hypothetical protein
MKYEERKRKSAFFWESENVLLFKSINKKKKFIGKIMCCLISLCVRKKFFLYGLYLFATAVFITFSYYTGKRLNEFISN